MTFDTNDQGGIRDPRYDRMRQPQRRSLTPWIIGGLVALAVVVGVLLMLPHDTDNAAINGRPVATDATTVGGGTPSSNTPALAQRPATEH